MPKSVGPDLSVSQTAEKIHGEASSSAIRSVQRLIQRGVFPGAHKLNPSKKTSPYLIPVVEVDAFLATEKKRGQSRKD